MWLLTLVLSSTVIQDVLQLCNDGSGSAIAYFYFDFQNREKQQCQNLLRSLITQFCDHATHIPEALDRLYSACQSNRRDIDQDDLITTLQHIVQEPREAYIIVDALDECTEREALLELIERIVGWKISTLHILVTSRQEREIEDCLVALSWRRVDLQETVVAGDIEMHVRERLQNDSKLKKWPAKVQAEIEAALTEGAHGMYVKSRMDWVINAHVETGSDGLLVNLTRCGSAQSFQS